VSSHAAKLIVDLGEAAWRKAAPWKRLKKAINKRRVRRGKDPLPITDEDEKMLPKNTLTYAGIAGVVIGFGLQLFGVATCTPDEVAAGAQACVDPTAIDRLVNGINEALIGGGSIVAGIGRARAEKRHAAELAKALAAAQAAKPAQ
jgi:hypothetical protein